MTKFLDTKGLERVISKLKTLIAGKADKSHTHTKSQISDFPKSLPASDVAAWAKAAAKPGYSWGEISGKPSTFTPSSHTHSYIVPEGDNRSVATTPDSYKNKLSFAGIKYSNKIGSPTTSNYVYLVGLRGWSDSSGGNSHEIAFYEGGISHRDGASTSWGGWKQFIDSGNIGSQSVKYATTAGTANAVAWGNVTGKPSTFAPSSHTHPQYLTSHQSLANYYTKTDADSKFQAKGSYAAASHTHDDRYYLAMECNKMFQPKGSYATANHTHPQYLTSHQSLKTINGQSLVGSGNVEVTGREVVISITAQTYVSPDISDEDIKRWLTPYISEIVKSDCTVTIINTWNGGGTNYVKIYLKLSSYVFFDNYTGQVFCKLSPVLGRYLYVGSQSYGTGHVSRLSSLPFYKTIYINSRGITTSDEEIELDFTPQ